VNTILLGMSALSHDYGSPWWGTYRQIQERGGQVRKGERSTMVVLWKPVTRHPDSSDYQPDDQTKPGRYLLARTFSVFNADQCDGLRIAQPERPTVDPIEACEQVTARYLATGPKLTNGMGRAWYRPSRDVVGMPERSAFESAEAWHSTLFHELVHSSGHQTRLNREGVVEGHRFGDESYSKEELIAEMGAAMLCGLAGVEQVTLANSAAYIASWLRVLRGDPKLVVSAAASAQRAADLIAGRATAELEVAA